MARHKRFTAGKTLAQGGFTPSEHFNYRRVERRCAARNPMKKPRHLSWFFHWWTRRDSNPRPLGCEPNALPAELRAHFAAFWPFFGTKSRFLKFSIFVNLGGISPPNSGPTFAGRCASIGMRTERSPKWSAKLSCLAEIRTPVGKLYRRHNYLRQFEENRSGGKECKLALT